jgi:hypothetical protein
VLLGVKRRCSIFHAQVGLIRIRQKAHRDTLCQTCALDLVGFVGHVVHSGALGPLDFDALFFHARVGSVRIP